VHNAQHTPAPRINVGAAIMKATQALDENDYDKVLDLLEPVRPYAKEDDAAIIHELMREARSGQEYAQIRALVQSSRMKARGCERYRAFKQIYPDYPDTSKLVDICRPRVIDVLPKPFAWCEIPAGRVTLISEEGWDENYIPHGTSQTFDVQDFAIAKYPITNAQYAKFIEAGGYRNRRWWTDEGWEARVEGYEWNKELDTFQSTDKSWTEPRFWNDDKWNDAEQPVVGVSWYEALAFCNWLTELTGENVKLPTEHQWQRAAQGDDGRNFPWGNDWDNSRCSNNYVKTKDYKKRYTTPVTFYEGKGDSPYKVVDMSGNVWEWCLTSGLNGHQLIKGVEIRAIRGGSCDDILQEMFRCDYRETHPPHASFGYIRGFRICLNSKLVF
jgi:formylglycine-generating enzyme required for sulfatase activity